MALTDYDELLAGMSRDRFIEVDGQRVHLERWGEQGKPLLFLHGFGSSTYAFEELGPLLAHGRRVIAMDLNGFGFTERPRQPEAYSFAGQVELVRKVMDRLEIDEVDVVGHSYGGYLAMRLARDHPDRIRRMVLVSPALNMDVAPSSFIRSAWLRRMVYPGLRLLISNRDKFAALLSRAYHRMELLDGRRIDEYQRRLLVEGLDHAYRGFGASLVSLSENRVSLEDLHQPVLVVVGRQDGVVPLESVELALRQMPYEVRLVVIENCGHSVSEEQPEELARVINDFMLSGMRNEQTQP